ncbi:hypothetical protein N8I74_15580 [Chitiniphilus purpureus]|uniref:Uncharacterized protein n=1 Tax=Chitiniphilus purpureus TaxID=2981137 RepID=A0ABY6DML0_9NEIS|nr:hypothetical protein [Chitiniphilus sp. CD1]UXY14726.1 hypothetical protein N8I74_15580 [Chitiniphilus sp. CD1]
MAFYFRADDVPELQGLSAWEQRVLLRGTFIKERAVSTLLLLGIVIASVQFAINPLIERFFPALRSDTLPYAGLLLCWLFLLIWLRDTVMMNVLRPKIAVKRVELEKARAGQAAAQDDAAAGGER